MPKDIEGNTEKNIEKFGARGSNFEIGGMTLVKGPRNAALN
jgi:hypothetical protein